MKTPANPTPAAATAAGSYAGPERRLAAADRRTTREDRRNLERVMEDHTPRRDPERPGRRVADLRA